LLQKVEDWFRILKNQLVIIFHMQKQERKIIKGEKERKLPAPQKKKQYNSKCILNKVPKVLLNI
jgi:hypothetical protein